MAPVGHEEAAESTTPGAEVVHVGRLTIIERVIDRERGRVVARKSPRLDLSADDSRIARQQLRTEADLRLSLAGPGVLPVLDLTEAPGGPVIDGPWLAATLAGAVGEPAASMQVLRQLATTIERVHTAAWCHHDLGPRNVLLDDWARPVIGDFGTARRFGEPVALEGYVSLTPPSAAPELWRRETADPSSDVYALAVIAFLSLSGALPFQGSTADEMRDAHLDARRPIFPRELDESGAVQAVFDAAFALEVADRPASAPELVDMLDIACNQRAAETTGSFDARLVVQLGGRLESFAASLDEDERAALSAMLGRAELFESRERGRFTRRAMSHIGAAHVLVAADEAGLLKRLAGGTASIGELGTTLGVPVSRLAPIVALLVTDGWLLETSGGFQLTPTVAAGYRSNPDAPLARTSEMWSGTGRWLIEGIAISDMTDEAGVAYAATVGTLAANTRHLADDLVRHLRHGSTVVPGASIIDIGCGAAPWSVAMLAGDPGATLDLVDRPRVLDVCIEQLKVAGVAERARALAHDWREVGPTADHDLAMLGNVCHCFQASTAAELVGRAAESLRAGGVLVIIDTMRSLRWTKADALAAIHLGLRTGEGTIHAASDYREWVREAGLDVVGRFPFPGRETPLVALIARRSDHAG